MGITEFPLTRLMDIRPKVEMGEIRADIPPCRVIMPPEWEAQVSPNEWLVIPQPIIRIMQDTDPHGCAYRIYDGERDPWSRILNEVNLAALRTGFWVKDKVPSWDDWLAEL